MSQISRLDRNIFLRTENLLNWLNLLDETKFYKDYQIKGSSNFALPLCLANPDDILFKKVCELLKFEGVEFRVGTAGGGNLALQPFLEGERFRVSGSLKNANFLHNYALYIGNGSHVSFEMITDLVGKLNAL